MAPVFQQMALDPQLLVGRGRPEQHGCLRVLFSHPIIKIVFNFVIYPLRELKPRSIGQNDSFWTHPASNKILQDFDLGLPMCTEAKF